MTDERTTGDRAHVVILTGGAPPDPHGHDIDLALTRAGAASTASPASLARKIAAEGFRHGYHRAAQDHHVVAAWVLPGAKEAARFAAFVTREIDPAFVTPAMDPADELLRCWERDQAARTVAGP